MNRISILKAPKAANPGHTMASIGAKPALTYRRPIYKSCTQPLGIIIEIQSNHEDLRIPFCRGYTWIECYCLGSSGAKCFPDECSKMRMCLHSFMLMRSSDEPLTHASNRNDSAPTSRLPSRTRLIVEPTNRVCTNSPLPRTSRCKTA